MHDAPHSHDPSSKRHRPATPTVFGAAFVAGAVAAFGINSFFDAHVSRSRPQVESEPIFVALRSLPQGAPVTVWDVALRDWPRAMLPDTALRAEDRFEGLILRHPLREGQPLLSVQLTRPDAGVGAMQPSITGALAFTGGSSPAAVQETFTPPTPAPTTGTAVVTAAPSGPATTTTGTTAGAGGRAAVEGPGARDDVEVFAPVQRLDDTPAPVAVNTAADGDADDARIPPAEVDPVPEVGPATEAVTETLPSNEVDAGRPAAIVESDASEGLTTDGPDTPRNDGVVDAIGSDATTTDPAGVVMVPPVVDATPTIAVEGESESDTTVISGAGPATDVDGRTRIDVDVRPLPPVAGPVATTQPRAPVPPAPGSDIETPLAVASRQRAAQTAANRPGSVLASPDPAVGESLPIPTTPASDVSLPLEAVAAEHQPPTGGTPVHAAQRHPLPGHAAPLRHLVVPERIAMQADSSFVAPRATPERAPQELPPASSAPETTSRPSTPGTTRTQEPPKTRADRPSRPTSSPQDAPARSGGPVMRAIGSMLQGFNTPTTPESSRRR